MIWRARERSICRLAASLLIIIGFPLALSGCVTVELWEAAKEPALLGFEVVVPASDPQPRYVDWSAIRYERKPEKGRLELGSDACAEHAFIEHLRRPPDNEIPDGERKAVWARTANGSSTRWMASRAKLAPCQTLLTVLRFDETRTTSLIAVESSGEERGRVDIKEPRLPDPWAWPLLPITVAVDVVTFPLQLPYILYMIVFSP